MPTELEQRAPGLLVGAVRITRTEYSTGIATTIAEAVMDQPPGTYWIISEESLAALQAQQPVAQAVAYCDPSDPINSTAFAWPGTDRTERHREPLFTHPQPPSIPEPSGEDVDESFAAFNESYLDDGSTKRAAIRAALTTYTARLRESLK